MIAASSVTGRKPTQTAPVPVAGLSDVIAIGAEKVVPAQSSLTATVRCWETTPRASSADGTTTNSSTPVVVSGLSNAIGVAPGYDHSCAVPVDGTAKCWGSNVFGQIGHWNDVGTSIFAQWQSRGCQASSRLAVGAMRSCARLSDGTAKCWGTNLDGILGDGTQQLARCRSLCERFIWRSPDLGWLGPFLCNYDRRIGKVLGC